MQSGWTTYIHDATQAGDNELADSFRRAQADSRKDTELGKGLLRSRLARRAPRTSIYTRGNEDGKTTTVHERNALFCRGELLADRMDLRGVPVWLRECGYRSVAGADRSS
jgi:hypothetical protein